MSARIDNKTKYIDITRQTRLKLAMSHTQSANAFEHFSTSFSLNFPSKLSKLSHYRPVFTLKKIYSHIHTPACTYVLHSTRRSNFRTNFQNLFSPKMSVWLWLGKLSEIFFFFHSNAIIIISFKQILVPCAGIGRANFLLQNCNISSVSSMFK